LSPSNDRELVSVTIDDRPFLVPRGEVLLACIQYIVSSVTPLLGRFCWSNECGNCEMSVRREEALLSSRLRGCQTTVEDGMELSELTPDLRYWLTKID
jgi:hypothetical protein